MCWMCVQAKWLAQVLSGRALLPSRADMEADISAFYKLMQKHNVPVRYTHNQVCSTSSTQSGLSLCAHARQLDWH